MDLFTSVIGQPANLLHKDGTVHYYGAIISQADADLYLIDLLNNIAWKNDVAIIYGKQIVTKRKVAWYGESNYQYSYSNTTKTAQPWTKTLLRLKALVEKETGETFNSCLLNLYHDGLEGMAWHSDAEKDLKEKGAIGSLSFGAERKFCFKHKQSQETVSLYLQNGSLLVMKGCTQKNWLHRLPTTKSEKKPRVNLTFRTISAKYRQQS
ncbi:MAG: alkylated DNA repair dioxygenase AlkB [Alteromonadaceae bacterium]|jgi:alkylated DNA repair dioxygenase AlkB